MRAPLLVVVILGCAATTVPADLIRGTDNHRYHSSSTSTSTSTTTEAGVAEAPAAAAASQPAISTVPADGDKDDGLNFFSIVGNIPFISQLDIMKIHLPLLSLPSQNKNPWDPSSAGGVIVRPGADGHGRPPLYPPPAATEVPEVPELPEVPDEPELPEEPEIPGLPELPELPELPDWGTLESLERPTSPTSAQAPESPAGPAQDAAPVPDIATFDIVLTNRSRLADDTRVFAFGGLFEITVNRTGSSVDVVMVRVRPQNETESPAGDLEPAAPAPAPAQERLMMAMRAPSVTGRPQSGGGKDELGSQDEHDEKKKSEGGNDSETDAAVFINDTKIIGVKLGVVTFNTSGIFKLNASLADDFMTVIISQIGDLVKQQGAGKADPAAATGPAVPGPGEVGPTGGRRPIVSARRSGVTQQAKGDPSGSAGPSPAAILLTVLAVGGLATLGAALLVAYSRARLRVAPFAQRGDHYGTVEFGQEAVQFSRDFE